MLSSFRGSKAHEWSCVGKENNLLSLQLTVNDTPPEPGKHRVRFTGATVVSIALVGVRNLLAVESHNLYSLAYACLFSLQMIWVIRNDLAHPSQAGFKRCPRTNPCLMEVTQ